MLNINIICIGKIKENYINGAIAEYSKRLSRFCNLSITELSDEKLPDKINSSTISEIKIKECEKIKQHISKDSYIIALDLNRKRIYF